MEQFPNRGSLEGERELLSSVPAGRPIVEPSHWEGEGMMPANEDTSMVRPVPVVYHTHSSTGDCGSVTG